jgi:hypothetical protein
LPHWLPGIYVRKCVGYPFFATPIPSSEGWISSGGYWSCPSNLAQNCTWCRTVAGTTLARGYLASLDNGYYQGNRLFPFLSPKLRKEPRNCMMRLQEKLEVFPLNALPDIRGSSKNVLLCKELFCSFVLDFSTDYYLIAFNANSDLSYFNP